MKAGALTPILPVLIAAALVVASMAQASHTSRPVGNDIAFASRGQPRLALRPKLIAPGGRLTFIGSGFIARRSVELLVGPPQSEGRFVGSTRSTRTGAFRKTLTVKLSFKPGPWVALACQHGCRIKAGASFRITVGRG